MNCTGFFFAISLLLILFSCTPFFSTLYRTSIPGFFSPLAFDPSASLNPPFSGYFPLTLQPLDLFLLRAGPIPKVPFYFTRTPPFRKVF